MRWHCKHLLKFQCSLICTNLYKIQVQFAIMDEAKAPTLENSWEAIDIFLFSNGQQYSPPRKYHLRTEELQSWDFTLGLLARCQYGSMHASINMYTIDGKRIDGPMEISNGGAYVAVIPPDPFIAAGYEKYLMKASKSWEKRQAKKSGSAEQVSNPDEILSQIDYLKYGTNIDSIKTADQNIKIETIGSANTKDEPKNKEQMQGKATIPQHVQKFTVNTIRHLEKRRPSVEPPDTRTSILRKKQANHIVPPSNRRASNVRRDSTGKGNVKLITQKNTDIKAGVIDNKDTTTSKRPTLISVPSKAVAEPSLEHYIENIKMSTTITPNNRSQLTDNSQVECAIENKDTSIILISNFFKTTEDEMQDQISDRLEPDAIPLISHGYPNKKLNIQPSKPLVISEQKPFETIIKEFQAGDNRTSIIVGNTAVTGVPEILTIAYNELRSESSSKQKLDQDVSLPCFCLSEKYSDDNSVILGNKGDKGVNLKLLIEIRDQDGIVTTVKRNFAHKSRSLTDIKEEQGKNDNNNSEMLTQSKSLDSIPVSTHACSKDPKVVVVRCPCDHNNHEDTVKNKKLSEKDVKTYFIILPIVTNAEKERCHCKCNKEANTACDKGVQNVNSFTKLNGVSSAKEIIMSVAVSESEKLESGRINPDSINESRVEKKEYVVTKQQVALVNGECQLPEYVIATQISPKFVEPSKIDCVVEIKDNTSIKTVQDECTQTEWCSVLLEVRRHEDGRYTFHLPPLHVVKNYAG